MFFNNCNRNRECCCQKEEKPNYFCKKRVVEVVDMYKIEKIGTRCPPEEQKGPDCNPCNDSIMADGGFGYNEVG